jgi:hypothetical protein
MVQGALCGLWCRLFVKLAVLSSLGLAGMSQPSVSCGPLFLQSPPRQHLLVNSKSPGPREKIRRAAVVVCRVALSWARSSSELLTAMESEIIHPHPLWHIANCSLCPSCHASHAASFALGLGRSVSAMSMSSSQPPHYHSSSEVPPATITQIYYCDDGMLRGETE